MSMERIVGRDILRCHIGGGYELVRRDLGNGHREYRVAPLKTWEHIGVLSDRAYEDRLACMEATKEERKQANLERAAKRARTRVRHLCKVRGYDTLLTTTYRENVTDRAIFKAHLQEFHRRMSKLIPGWSYVAAFERQKRGAWHAHMAVHRLPRELSAKGGVKVKSFQVIRAVWRAVTGEYGGNIDVQARKRNSGRAPSKIAAYLSKYMVKAFEEGEAWSNRFSASKGLSVPKPERIRFMGYDMCSVAQAVFDDAAAFLSDQVSWGLNRWRDCMWWVFDANIRPKPCWEAS
jgi:hypothetical protein